MATREELYRGFGPKLLEAIVLVIRDEINDVRTNAGLSEKTEQNIIDAIDTKLSNLEDYDWQSE
ncbi:MAG: hypothetical protein ACTSPI_11780 [Candidatus Heimdallarchaeaceae archaeon]